jgi:hypothetical protein
MFKRYLKWKFIALIQNELIHYLSEMDKYNVRKYEWENKKYPYSECNTKCSGISEDTFNETKQRQIIYSADKWKENYYKHQAVNRLLEIIKDL